MFDQEETSRPQISRIKWHCEGERNTRFMHLSTLVTGAKIKLDYTNGKLAIRLMIKAGLEKHSS